MYYSFAFMEVRHYCDEHNGSLFTEFYYSFANVFGKKYQKQQQLLLYMQ